MMPGKVKPETERKAKGKSYFPLALLAALAAVLVVPWLMGILVDTNSVPAVTTETQIGNKVPTIGALKTLTIRDGDIISEVLPSSNQSRGSEGGQTPSPSGPQEQQQQQQVVVVPPTEEPQTITQPPIITQPVALNLEPEIFLDTGDLTTGCDLDLAEKLFDTVVHDHALDSERAIAFNNIIENSDIDLKDRLILTSLKKHDLSTAKRILFAKLLDEDEILLKKKLIFNAVHEFDHHNFHDFDHDLHASSGLPFKRIGISMVNEICAALVDP